MILKNRIIGFFLLCICNFSYAQINHSVTIECYNLNFKNEVITNNGASSTLIKFNRVVTSPNIYLLPTQIYVCYSFLNKRNINIGLSACYNKNNFPYTVQQISNEIDFSDTVYLNQYGTNKFDFIGIMFSVSKLSTIQKLEFYYGLQTIVTSKYNDFEFSNFDVFYASNRNLIQYGNDYTKAPNTYGFSLLPSLQLDLPIYKNIYFGLKYVAGLKIQVQKGYAETSRLSRMENNNIEVLNEHFLEKLKADKTESDIIQNASILLKYKFGKHK
jgi:hypothetical protein